jgi:hypothetical protein
MADLKTKPRKVSVPAFLKSVEHETRRRDAKVIKEMMTRITGEKPKYGGIQSSGLAAITINMKVAGKGTGC